jgi:hypothetical protein
MLNLHPFYFEKLIIVVGSFFLTERMLHFANLQLFIKQKAGEKEDVAKGVCFPLCLFVDLAGHPWSLPFAARCVAVASARPQPQQQQQQRPPERKAGGGFMDAGSRSSGGAGFDDDDGLAARREVSSALKGNTRSIMINLTFVRVVRAVSEIR